MSRKNNKLKWILEKQKQTKKEMLENKKKVEILYMNNEPGFLIPENDLEKTFQVKQKDIFDNIDLQTQTKIFDLRLNTFGPYKFDYTRNGRYLVIGGQKGHIAEIDWVKKYLKHEIHALETVRDVKFLHNDKMYAVAQKKYVHIYDKNGVEIHCLKDHKEILKLDFLPYHFLLTSINRLGILTYQDISIGKIISQIKTKLGICDTLTHNPYNSVTLCGHQNGTITMWCPTMKNSLIQMFTHKGFVRSIAFDISGFYMVTAGNDGLVKIWDIRKYHMLHSYRPPKIPSIVDVSQRGLLAIAFNNQVHIWKNALIEKQSEPYMTHKIDSSSITDMHFCPYEDVLGLGHSKGFSSIVIPGSGEPNYDTYEANPFETKKQKQEHEIKQLLEKLPPETIQLDPNFIGKFQKGELFEKYEKEKQEWMANNPGKKFPKSFKVFKEEIQEKDLKEKLKKYKNIIDPKREKIRILNEEKKRKIEEMKENEKKRKIKEQSISVLDRFKKKTKL